MAGRRRKPMLIIEIQHLHSCGESYDEIWRQLGYRRPSSFDIAVKRAGWPDLLYRIKGDREAMARWNAGRHDTELAHRRSRYARRHPVKTQSRPVPQIRPLDTAGTSPDEMMYRGGALSIRLSHWQVRRVLNAIDEVTRALEARSPDLTREETDQLRTLQRAWGVIWETLGRQHQKRLQRAAADRDDAAQDVAS